MMHNYNPPTITTSVTFSDHKYPLNQTNPSALPEGLQPKTQVFAVTVQTQKGTNK